MQPAKRAGSIWIAAVLVAAAIFNASPVTAAAKLPQICTDPTSAGKAVNSACGGYQQTGQIYRTPLDTDLVRVMTDGATSSNWESPAYQWLPWTSVAVGRLYDSCLDDIPEGSAVTGTECKNWGMVPRLAPAAPTFTAAPTSGAAPLAVVVKWNVPSGTNCQAGGAWTGAKAAAGTETVSVSTSGSLTLACTVPGPMGPDKAVLSWTPPTQNEDGSALTNLAGFNLYSGTMNPPTNVLSPMLGPTVTTYTFANLPAGTTQFFGIDAQNTLGARSAPLAIGSKVIVGVPTSQPWSGSAIPITVTAPAPKVPRAPVLTVQ